jgi:hypothetical protein
MAKDAWYGTTYDGILRSKALRNPGFAVYIWNPNRTTINDVVLGITESPRYNITPWVISIDLKENVPFENEQDSIVSTAKMEVQYDPKALPIQITEKTVLDGTPVRIYQGDNRVPQEEWVCVFTGFFQGNPAITEEGRANYLQKKITVTAVDRAAAYTNNVVTAKSYEFGEDIGRSLVETAIQFMGLNRREVRIGYQSYSIGHLQSQVVDIEVMAGLYQMLFCVGKKPRFDSLGFLVAADADLDKAPARIHRTKELIVRITRQQVSQAINNSVRLLGLSNKLTRVIERERRLAHGSITSGFFEEEIDDEIYFSEDKGEETGGRKAIDTWLSRDKVHTAFGTDLDQEAYWTPFLLPDGETCFGGRITFNTGSVPELRTALIASWFTLKTIQLLEATIDWVAGLLGDVGFAIVFVAEATALLSILHSLTNLGRLEWEVAGKPVELVYQQICATAQLYNLLTQDIREKEYRNDWIYDIDVLEARAKEMLKRELVKAWTYEIEMIDDPILDVDDIIEIDGKQYYITAIRKKIGRQNALGATMAVSAWRVQ